MTPLAWILLALAAAALVAGGFLLGLQRGRTKLKAHRADHQHVLGLLQDEYRGQIYSLHRQVEGLELEKAQAKAKIEKLERRSAEDRYRPPIWKNTTLFFHRIAKVLIEKGRSAEGTHFLNIKMLGEADYEEGLIHLFGPSRIDLDLAASEYDLEPKADAPLTPEPEKPGDAPAGGSR